MMKRIACGLLAAGICWQALAAETVAPARDGLCGPVPCLSGGIGADEQETLRAVRQDYNLQLTLATRGSGEYQADAAISVSDAGGKPVLRLDGAGPLFFAQLAPGRYQVEVSVRGQSQRREVVLPARGTRQLVLYWAPEP